jgi:hypothetical protein
MRPNILLFFVFILFSITSCKLKSSSNNTASNQDSIVPETYIHLPDTILKENSGLILWNNHFWTFNDSGGKNEIYGLDFNAGKILITIQISNAKNIDWEDIAQDKNFIYIAETGNNLGTRHDQKIYKVRKKDINSNPIQEVKADSISFQFADQVNFTPSYHQTEYDCEALIIYHDSIFVFTKDWLRFITKVYGLPIKKGDYTVFPRDSFNVNGLITGADILPNGKFVLIGYKNFHSLMWTFQKTRTKFFSNPRFIDLGMLENAQTEGVCFSTTGDLFFSCEQTVNYSQQIWKIGKNKLKFSK